MKHAAHLLFAFSLWFAGCASTFDRSPVPPDFLNITEGGMDGAPLVSRSEAVSKITPRDVHQYGISEVMISAGFPPKGRQAFRAWRSGKCEIVYRSGERLKTIAATIPREVFAEIDRAFVESGGYRLRETYASGSSDPSVDALAVRVGRKSMRVTAYGYAPRALKIFTDRVVAAVLAHASGWRSLNVPSRPVEE